MTTFGQFALKTETTARHNPNCCESCNGVTTIAITDAFEPENSALFWKFKFTMSDGRELTVGDYNGKGGWVRGIQIEIVGDQDAADIIELLRGAAGRIQDQYYQNNRRCDAYEQE